MLILHFFFLFLTKIAKLISLVHTNGTKYINSIYTFTNKIKEEFDNGPFPTNTYFFQCCIIYASVEISCLLIILRDQRKSDRNLLVRSVKRHEKPRDAGGIVGNAAVTRNLEPTALFIGLSTGNGGGRQPGRIVQTRKRSEAEKAGRWMLVLVGACDSSSRERAAPPDTIAEHLRSDPR